MNHDCSKELQSVGADLKRRVVSVWLAGLILAPDADASDDEPFSLSPRLSADQLFIMPKLVSEWGSGEEGKNSRSLHTSASEPRALWDRRRAVANANANARSGDNPVSARGRGWRGRGVTLSLTLQFNRITGCLREG